MARKPKIKKLVVKLSREAQEGQEIEPETGSKEGQVIERFIVPMLKPFQLQPLPIETKLPKLPKPFGHGIKELRQLLSDEKARIMATIKSRKPLSLYHLAKLLNRDFKAVRQDVKLLENYGFVKLVHDKDKKTKKKRLKPMLVMDKLQITVEL